MSNNLQRVFLRGGLGNQFFQWIYALNLCEQGIPVTLDDSFIRKIADNQAKGIVELHSVFESTHLPITSHLKYIKRIEPFYTRMAYYIGVLSYEGKTKLAYSRPKFHYGYFQNSTYLTSKVNQLLQDSIHSKFLCKLYPTFPTILRERKYAALHIRGGDYMRSGYNYNEIGVLDELYYTKVFQKIISNNLPIVVVTDDARRARSLMKTINTAGLEIIHLSDFESEKSDPLLALSVMINSEVLYCANSSFSAMAGYLNVSAKIYAPSPWFRGNDLSHISPAKSKWSLIDSSFQSS